MIDLAEELFENPIFVYDLSGKILAQSSSETSQKIWKDLIPNEYLIADYSMITSEAGVISKIIHQDEPVYATFPYSPYSFMGSRIRDKNGAVGIATIVEVNEIKESDRELLVYLCKIILFELLYRERISMQTIPYYPLLKDIIEGKTEDASIHERCRILNLNIPRSMHLIVIEYSPLHKNSLSLYFLREKLMSLLPDCLCIIYDESLLILTDKKHVKSSLLNRIQMVFSSYHCRIRISRPFTDIRHLKNAFTEIQAIQHVCARLNIDKVLTYYKDIQLYHFMELASRANNLNEFCDPALFAWESHDREKQADLYRSVEAYLEAGRSIQKAAERMNLHKNTLYYRLKKAEEIAGIDLNDENTCFNIQFSMRMKRMMT